MEVLNPLAREYKSIGTLKKELAGLQEELAQAHRQVWKHFAFPGKLALYHNLDKLKSIL